MKKIVIGLALLTIGGVAGGLGALLWVDPYWKVPYEVSEVCYQSIAQRLGQQIKPRYVSGGKRDYGWEHWVGLYDGPGPDFTNRTLLGVAFCKVVNDNGVGGGGLRVIELDTSFDHQLRSN